MPIKQKGQVVFLEGLVGVEDAETLYAMLRDINVSKINAGNCEHMHASVLQLIIGFHLKVTKYPDNTALEQWLKNSLSISHSVANDAAHFIHEVNNG
jgi:hypothetical protein